MDVSDELTRKVDDAMKVARKTEYSPSPFDTSRLFAMADAAMESRKKQKSRAWVLSFASVGAMAIVAVIATSGKTFSARVGEDTLLTLNDKNVNRKLVRMVRVELPEGVEFYHEGMPELDGAAVITLPMGEGGAESEIPVVINSKSKGMKRVRVRYLDAQEREVSSETVKIKFSEQEQRV